MREPAPTPRQADLPWVIWHGNVMDAEVLRCSCGADVEMLTLWAGLGWTCRASHAAGPGTRAGLKAAWLPQGGAEACSESCAA